MSWFSGRHAIITGGGSGIGAAVARVLKDKGAAVTITGRDRNKLAATAESLGVAYHVADVTDRKAVARTFAEAADHQGVIEILVNNAGVAEAVPFGRLTDQQWDETLAVNLTGVYNCTKAVIDGMLDKGGGRIVNIASTAALTGYAYVSAYCAAKHGVLGLTRALALEYATRGITVNAVCPGYTDTDIVRRAIERIMEKTDRSREEALAELTKTNPQLRLVQPEEVADTVIWLCRQESVNGQAISVSGGETM